MSLSGAVTSQVNLNHANLDKRALRGIQRTRKVQKNQSQPLGLTPNLISLVPAVMANVTVSIDFILDHKNRLAQLGGLINSDSFFTALSLAPAVSAVAKTTAGLADKIIQTFIPAEESSPILEFSGDFNIATGCLRDCYYAILGTKDESNALPPPDSKFEVRNDELYVNDKPATQWSYVILDVRCTDTRPRELSQGAEWDLKLNEAEDTARLVIENPLSTDEERKSTWNKCLKLIDEAQVLLRADPNFLRQDATNIIMAAIYACRKVIEEQTRTTGLAPTWTPDQAYDLATLGLPSEVNLCSAIVDYAEKLSAARQVLKAAFR